MKTILSFVITLEKEFNEKSAGISIMNIVKDMIGSNFLKEVSDQSYHRYIWVLKMTLRHGSVLTLVESLNAEDDGSKRL